MTGARLFTVKEAEATLPLVNRVVGDLLAAYPRWKEAVARYELVTGASRAVEAPELRAARELVTRLAEKISDYLLELEQIGCVFKGFEAGLVDFYALKDDRLILLCWKQGEDHITHWHEVDAGFAGRQPIDEAMLTETVIG
jgi:hypothetical protein